MPDHLQWSWEYPTTGEPAEFHWPARYTLGGKLTNTSKDPVACDALDLVEEDHKHKRSRVAGYKSAKALAANATVGVDGTVEKTWDWKVSFLKIPNPRSLQKKFTYTAKTWVRGEPTQEFGALVVTISVPGDKVALASARVFVAPITVGLGAVAVHSGVDMQHVQHGLESVLPHIGNAASAGVGALLGSAFNKSSMDKALLQAKDPPTPDFSYDAKTEIQPPTIDWGERWPELRHSLEGMGLWLETNDVRLRIENRMLAAAMVGDTHALARLAPDHVEAVRSLATIAEKLSARGQSLIDSLAEDPELAPSAVSRALDEVEEKRPGVLSQLLFAEGFPLPVPSHTIRAASDIAKQMNLGVGALSEAIPHIQRGALHAREQLMRAHGSRKIRELFEVFQEVDSPHGRRRRGETGPLPSM